MDKLFQMNKTLRTTTALFLSLSAFTVLPYASGRTISAWAQDSAYDFRSYGSDARQRKLSNVRIQGAERIEPQTILSYLSKQPGEQYTQRDLSESLKSLYATGLFADVNISDDKGVWVIDVVENPLINVVAFEGNKRIEDDELSTETSSRARTVLTRATVQNDVARIYELYRRSGRFSAKVDPKIIKLDQNRVNLVFEIDEGPVTEIRGIKFVGNEVFDDGDLADVISSKEARWYRFLSTDDRYDPDRLAYDQELLRRFYLKNGYVDFRISSAVAELTQDKEAFYITFSLEEGDRYKVGSVKIDASAAPKELDASQLAQYVTLQKGDWYDAEEVDKIIANLTDALGDMQYAFVNIRPDLRRNTANKTVDVVLKINETSRVFVDKINISGNVRTLDKVIRREFELAEGDPFNRTKLDESENNINKLGFFEKVKIQPKKGDAPDQTDIDVEVQEKSTGEISIGAGFSTTDGPLADLRIRERNLLGKGQDLSFGTTIAGQRTQFDVAFTEPYFLNRDLAASVNAFHTTQDLQSESSYDQKRTGGGFSFKYPLSDKLRQEVGYSLVNNTIENVGSDASRFVSDQEGDRVTSSITQKLTYNDLDNPIFPRSGQTLWLDNELAGLGGDARYFSTKLGGIQYYPVTEKITFNILGEVGHITGYSGEDVKINERFFLGGNTLRGFQYAGVGPRDLTTDDSLGGNTFYRSSAEFEFPVGLPDELGIKGHAFSDIGSLWNVDENGTGLVDESSMRASAGFGVSWASPMGPVRVDYATPLANESYDDKQAIRFNFGTRF